MTPHYQLSRSDGTILGTFATSGAARDVADADARSHGYSLRWRLAKLNEGTGLPDPWEPGRYSYGIHLVED